MDFDTEGGPTEALDSVLLAAQMRVGTVLRGKWRLDALLGVGGMATVYAATHRNGSRAAVKILHRELSINQQLRVRFLREGYVANTVGHEGAVKVIDDDIDDDGSMFLVTELLDGETLEQRRLRLGGSLSEDEVLLVADQILDVLVAAHAKGVVHRDLKPENVFLTRQGQVKVLDFGIARLRHLSTTSTATKAGTTLGTPAYMPPEQARGLWDEVDARSDVWACGATMFHLVSGRWVHEGRTPNEQLLSAMTRPAAPCSSLSRQVSPAVARVIDGALEFDRDRRWPDAQRMQDAVRRAYHERHGVAIATAPRLEVAHCVDATMPSLQPVASADTGRPVENGRHDHATGARRARLWGPRTVVGTLIVGLLWTSVVWLVSSGRGARHAEPASVSDAFAHQIVIAPTAPTAGTSGTGSGSESASIAGDEAREPSAPDSGALTKRTPSAPRPLPPPPSPSVAPAASAPIGYRTDDPY